MSDKFEQWVKDNQFFATTPVSGQWVVSSGAVVSEWNAALSSLQGEAVGEAFNGRCFLYDAHPVKNLHIENGAKLFTYPPDASAKIAELEAKLAEVEKDAERYRMLRSLDVTPYNKWDKVQELLHRAIDSADTIEMVDTAVDAAIQGNKKGIVCTNQNINATDVE